MASEIIVEFPAPLTNKEKKMIYGYKGEVVRCKDCKWYKESKNPEIYPIRFCYRLINDKGVRVGYNCDGDDFCSKGERKEDERTAIYYGDNKLFETVVIDERKEDDKR